jgi:hypothetical protein
MSRYVICNRKECPIRDDCAGPDCEYRIPPKEDPPSQPEESEKLNTVVHATSNPPIHVEKQVED